MAFSFVRLIKKRLVEKVGVLEAASLAEVVDAPRAYFFTHRTGYVKTSGA